jgi:uncharacterized membrane protein
MSMVVPSRLERIAAPGTQRRSRRVQDDPAARPATKELIFEPIINRADEQPRTRRPNSMPMRLPSSTARIAGHPIHPMLVPFPIAFFTLALVMDIAYWQSSNLTWKHFAEWLLLAGLVMGGLAAVAGAVDLLGSRDVRSRGPVWPHAIGNAVVMLLAFLNSLVHARDGWTGVMPWGLALSAATVLLMLVTGWLGGSLVYRHGVGIRPSDGVDHA